MTDCNWTEKVSLLIDGELAAADARAVETHLGDCFACRLAREDFLLLRHQLSSYRPEVNLLAQRRALDTILGTNDSARPAVTDSDWRERAARLFALPRLGPALVAASALVLVCLAVALLMFRGGPSNELAETPWPGVSVPTPGGGSQTGVKDSAPAPTPVEDVAKIKPRGAGGIGASKSQPAAEGATELAKGVKPKGANSTNLTDRARANDSGGAAQVARAAAGGGDDDLPLIIPPRFPFGSAAAADAAAADAASADVAAVASEPRAEAAPAGLSPARHAEQAEQLLRSFRNADAGDAADIAYERGRSQELLYQNIVLRREAASRGNVAVESVLGSLEPILTDIANLPDKPAREDVRSINERMKKKDIVAMLQIAARD